MSKRCRHPGHIKQIDIISAVARAVKKEFGCKIYSDEVLKQFAKPCFFIKCITSTRQQTKYIVKKTVSVFLTYFPKDAERNEVHYVDVFDRLHGLFQDGIQVKDRYLHINRISDMREGDEADILQVSLAMTYLDYIGRQHSDEYIGDLQMNIENVHGPRDMETISKAVFDDEKE